MAKLVPKTYDQMVGALEDHLFLLTQSLHGLSGGDAAYLRELAGKLRALVCSSAGLDGLLWRLCDAVGVDDAVFIRYPGKVDTSHSLTRGLKFVFATVAPDGSGDERVPLKQWSLRDHIKTHEALFSEGESVTHEELIKELADRAGIAHEADGISKVIARINDHFVGDIQPYFAILDSDARLALVVGERAIQAAVGGGYVRRRAPALPPPLRSLNSVRFCQKLDLPKVRSGSLREGSIMYMIDANGTDRAEKPIRFPPLESSGVILSATITKRGRLALAVDGLPFPNFGCQCAMPVYDGKPIVIIITWKGIDVRAYVAGEQVAGIRDMREGTNP